MTKGKEKDKCDTCEHRGDSSNEYCGSCGGGVESNWKEAGWSKDKTINELRTRNAELEKQKSSWERVAEHRLGVMDELRTRVAEQEKLIEWHKTDTHDAMEWKNELQTRLSTLLKASEGMEKALEYFGNENSWNVDPDSSYLEMKRPGGGFQDGIVLVSHNLRPWILAKQALADFMAVKGETK